MFKERIVQGTTMIAGLPLFPQRCGILICCEPLFTYFSRVVLPSGHVVEQSLAERINLAFVDSRSSILGLVIVVGISLLVVLSTFVLIFETLGEYEVVRAVQC